MKLAIDAMSGDLGSKIVVDACKSFLTNNKEVELYVVGKLEELKELKGNPRVTLVEANEVLEMTENILAIRRKKESSMVKTMMLAKDGTVDAVVSCGNTGAYYACAMLFLKRIEGIEKSCLMANLPTANGKGVYMLDVGANAENTANQLKTFAIMGNVYARSVEGIAQPKVALLNIGSEEHKGDEVHHQTYQLLKEMDSIHFVGNIEGRDIISGNVDVVVTDGFSGNIALKSLEGASNTLMKALKESLMGSLSGKIGAMFAKSALRKLKNTFSSDTAGGALMMGFVKPVIKAHGASNARAFESAMHLAVKMVSSEVVEKMKVGLNESEN